MAYGCKEVSKHAPCPICGRTHHCCTTDTGTLICKSTKISPSNFRFGETVIGKDNQDYVYAGISRGGNPRFIASSEWVASKSHQSTWSNPKNTTPAIKKQKPVRQEDIPVRDNDFCDKVYRRLLDLLVLDKKHELYLRGKESGFSKELIEKYNIKSFPENDKYRYEHKDTYITKNRWRKDLAKQLFEEFGDLTGVPGFYLNQKNEWTMAGMGGILFPMYDPFGRLYRLRIRLDQRYTEDGEDLGKYHNFSSSKDVEKDGMLVNRYQNGCSANNKCSIYAQPGDEYNVVFVTEGEKKGIIGNNIMHIPIVTVPGVQSYRKLLDEVEFGNGMKTRFIDELKLRGTTVIVMAFDADKTVNEDVLKSEKSTIDLLREEGFLIAVADWDMSKGKGLDDLLNNGYKPNYSMYYA